MTRKRLLNYSVDIICDIYCFLIKSLLYIISPSYITFHLVLFATILIYTLTTHKISQPFFCFNISTNILLLHSNIIRQAFRFLVLFFVYYTHFLCMKMSYLLPLLLFIIIAKKEGNYLRLCQLSWAQNQISSLLLSCRVVNVIKRVIHHSIHSIPST